MTVASQQSVVRRTSGPVCDDNLANQSRKNFLQIAHSDVRECVNEFRAAGWAMDVAFHHLAQAAGLARTRPAKLMWRNSPTEVKEPEQHRIALAIVRLLNGLAIRHELAAARCRARADAIAARERHKPPTVELGKCGNSGDILGVCTS